MVLMMAVVGGVKYPPRLERSVLSCNSFEEPSFRPGV